MESFLIFLLILLGIDRDISEMDKIKKIIIPLIAGIGDAVIFTSCLRQLDKIFQNAEITILTNHRTHELLNDTYPHMKFVEFQSFLKLYRLRNNYDLMISPLRKIKHYLMAFVIHPRCLIGYNFSLSIKRGESHIVRANRILNQLGCESFMTPMIQLSETTKDMSFDLIKNTVHDPSKDLVSLIVGGRWASRTYPPSRYKCLTDILINQYDVDILLIGSSSGMGKYIAEGIKRVYNFVGRTSIKEVIGLIYHSDFVIGPNGGLLNISMTLNKPIIGLFGPVNPDTMIMDKYLDHVLFIENCKYQPCYNEEHEPLCPYDKVYCMEIGIEDIVNKFDKVYSMK